MCMCCVDVQKVFVVFCILFTASSSSSPSSREHKFSYYKLLAYTHEVQKKLLSSLYTDKLSSLYEPIFSPHNAVGIHLVPAIIWLAKPMHFLRTLRSLEEVYFSSLYMYKNNFAPTQRSYIFVSVLGGPNNTTGAMLLLFFLSTRRSTKSE